jgi:ABC-type cobalamin/Fe3+-siderophores transport system ATPase subunit
MTSPFSVTTNRYPTTNFEFKSVNVLLGANGSGKSSTLKEIRDYGKANFKGEAVIYVEGGRAIRLPASFKLSMGNFHDYDSPEKIESNHRTKKPGDLSNRISDALMLLDLKTQEAKDRHSDDVHSWSQKGQDGSVPVREVLPFERLSQLFSNVFPKIKLDFNPKDKTMVCTKGEKAYSITNLSDGEKQVFSIITDIALLAESHSLILVDEPELNLNPLLAVRLWESIENDLPESTFIYTTHDVGFAMRGNVQNIYVLSDDALKVTEINNISEIDPEVLRNLLGSIPAILSTNRALITEGNQNSFDSLFYKWVIGTNDTVIVPMGSGGDVVAVSNRTGVWKAVAPSVKLTGIIDRDFKSDEALNALATSSTVILNYHEAESYLCIPEVVKTVTEKIGLVEKLPEINDIEAIIKQDFNSNRIKTVAKRVFEQTTAKLSVSISRNILDGVNSDDELRSIILAGTESQLQYAKESFESVKIEQMIEDEFAFWDKISQENNIEAMLKLCPGKSLIDKLVKLTGARNITDYLRACTKHIDVETIPALADLRKHLNNGMPNKPEHVQVG